MTKPKWPDREPISTEALAQDRLKALRFYLQHIDDRALRYTCDRCSHAPGCAPAFEPYNVNGRCLVSK